MIKKIKRALENLKEYKPTKYYLMNGRIFKDGELKFLPIRDRIYLTLKGEYIKKPYNHQIEYLNKEEIGELERKMDEE